MSFKTRCVVALAFMALGVSAHSSTYPNRDGAAEWVNRVNTYLNGNSTSVTVGPSGSGSTAAARPVGSPVAGGFGVRVSGSGGAFTGVLLDAKADLPLGDTGKKAVGNITAPVSKQAAAKAIGSFAVKMAAPIQIGMAVYELLEDLGVLHEFDPAVGANEFYLPQEGSGCKITGDSPNEWCQVANSDSRYTGVTKWLSGPPTCQYQFTCTISVGTYFQQSYSPQYTGAPSGSSSNVKLSEQELVDKIASESGWPSGSQQNIAQSFADAVNSGEPFTAGVPAVTGPSSVPGKQVSATEQVKLLPNTTTEAAPGYSGETQSGTKTTTSNSTHNVTYNGNKLTYNTVNNTNITITNNVTNQTTTNNNTQQTEDDSTREDPPEDNASDTPLPPVPKLYERKYPDGIVGIWNAKSEQLKQTQIFQFASSMMPMNVSGGSCPSWTLDLNLEVGMDMGVHTIQAPCWIWDVARVIVLVGALILARALVFGG